jgi:hypothetical protein
MKTKLLIAMLLVSLSTLAQELYVFTEPASNMAAKSIGLRLNNYIMPETHTSKTNYHAIPEIMVGVSKKVMLHGDVFLSNRNKGLSTEGGSIYAKYRFLSNDDVQKHFRMAVYGRYSFNNSDIHQEDINLYGHNSGYEAGVIATQLHHKVALSSGISYLKATDNGANHKYPYGSNNSKAVNYTLSIGKLMLPKEYKDYKQTNLNLMVEFLNQYNLGSGRYYMDIAPAVQLIFNSVARIDVGYRQQLTTTLYRTAPTGLFIRLEYNLFNVY